SLRAALAQERSAALPRAGAGSTVIRDALVLVSHDEQLGAAAAFAHGDAGAYGAAVPHFPGAR
ncbi:unnamed protein product, partial [Effrenium voratum]